tara:strand:+ start:598 stop:1896 length:1299 start_codon:yes stop_codon:yes gene_type:complete
MEDPEIAALFALADEAREAMQVGAELAQLCANEHDGDDSRSHASRTGQVVYTFDARGDVHACFGMQCRHVRLGQENQYVCGISGRVVGVEHTGDPDPGWTGRSRTSANPDDTAGTPVGGWMKRRDMYAASVAAYKMAGQLSDAEIQPAMMPPPAPTTPAVKRGALCVDESPDANAAPKKARSLRKESWSREAIDKLAKEAVGVINKLFIATPKAHQPSEPPPDPRLQNLEFVKAAAIRKYVKRCAAGESELNLDVLNNVIVHANAFVREQRAAAAAWRDAAAASSASARKSRTDAVFSGQIRNQLSQLIVSLWRASCLTKHFQSAKKGSDSFKPFAAGILYSLKRGLYLDDGTCVVPALEELAAHLPALRSASSTPAAKQLQSSSHRGICSIQRALTSIAEMNHEDALPARTLLRDAARQGAFLRELVSRNS